jgi:hypothetical protein
MPVVPGMGARTPGVRGGGAKIWPRRTGMAGWPDAAEESAEEAAEVEVTSAKEVVADDDVSDRSGGSE